MGNELELTKYLSALAGRVWVLRRLRRHSLVLGCRSFVGRPGGGAPLEGLLDAPRIHGDPRGTVFILIGYLLVALLLLM